MTTGMPLWRQIWRDQWRLLTFRRLAFSPENFRGYLLYGLLITWLCGVGRYWDNPRAELWQYWGLGSLAYVVLLAAVLWLIAAPLKPRHWQYRNVLLFVTLTSLPALLYAIPVERFMPLAVAQTVNVWFLAVVASWRVAMLAYFLFRVAGLSGLQVVVASLLPLTLIVTALSLLNLEHVVFNIMAGISASEKTANDAAYSILLIITTLSVLLSPILILTYVGLLLQARQERAE